MKIKICGQALGNWYRFSRDLWSRDAPDDCMNSVELGHRVDGWEPSFYKSFERLEQMYDGPRRFEDVKKGIKYLDKWLKKISKLGVFW